ncbi:DUF397 domain-containing protein [Streptomyces sparsogenes]|uniref:DUF397 domain-containing protein n=1 Tax=Streptomyces sparsogenes DSM 40356 TaxID=1331668 RepID=A0A1R1SMY7_9ACTN|nr:DUF397 domain-containing protein [Streptomyces sparsogenes]OMI39685.1 hypothetical protein SPAR_09738 [Streptomyces sparsogenes DSM 40356]
MSTDNWRKSSYSPNAGNCVYVATGDNHTVRLRESDAPNAILITRPATFGVFIRAIKAGTLDRLATD